MDHVSPRATVRVIDATAAHNLMARTNLFSRCHRLVMFERKCSVELSPKRIKSLRESCFGRVNLARDGEGMLWLGTGCRYSASKTGALLTQINEMPPGAMMHLDCRQGALFQT